jgi:hypothetical protein
MDFEEGILYKALNFPLSDGTTASSRRIEEEGRRADARGRARGYGGRGAEAEEAFAAMASKREQVPGGNCADPQNV